MPDGDYATFSLKTGNRSGIAEYNGNNITKEQPLWDYAVSLRE